MDGEEIFESRRTRFSEEAMRAIWLDDHTLLVEV
jgi:hypothetical protein